MASAVSNLTAVGNSGNERFNAEAAAWDSKPLVQEASRQAAKAILKRLENQKVDVSKIDNLEIGCGTGILSFLLAPHFHRIVSIDAAAGMIEVLRQKIARPDSPKNITPIAVLLEDSEDSVLPPDRGGTGRQKFDLITSHLVLHHIPELEGVLRTMLGCLKPGGKVMLTDFQNFGSEARRFHPESKMQGVARHGIQVDEMGALMSSVGFVNVDIQVAWSMEKSVEAFPGEFQTHGEPGTGGQGHKMHFPFILCYGERRGS